MISLDIILNVDPTKIRNIQEAEIILSKIRRYEEVKHCMAGVVLKQNRQFGGSYRVTSYEEAMRGIDNPGLSEWYVKFWPKNYFEELRDRLKSPQQQIGY